MNKIIIATATAAATAAATILWGSILASQSARAWGTWVVETHEYKDASYSIHDFNSIAGGRDLRVVVRGNTTGASHADFEQAVIALMNDHQPGYQSQTHFTSKPTARARESYKVVMVYGGKGVSENQACADPDAVSTNHAGGRVYLTAVFCWRDERINSVWARVGGVTSTTDQALADMTSGSMRRMFPNTWRYQ